jgi:hypothetical protein
MENCHRGGGNHGRKIAYGHSPTTNPVSRRHQLSRQGRRATRYPRATRQNQSCIPVQHTEPTSIPIRHRSPRSAHGDAAAGQHATDSRSETWANPTLMGAPRHPIPEQESYSSSSILHSSAASRERPLESDFSITGTGASQSATPTSGGATDQHAAMGRSANSGRGHRATQCKRAYSSAFILYSSAVSRAPASNPISPPLVPTTPICPKATSSRSARCGWAGPRLRGGRRGNRCQRELLVAIMHSCAVSQGGCDFQADL